MTGEVAAPTPAVLSFFQAGVQRLGVDTKLKSALDFPLESTLKNVFGQGQPMTLLTDTAAYSRFVLWRRNSHESGTNRTDRSIRADFPGSFPGDLVNAFLAEVSEVISHNVTSTNERKCI